jgi:hypothetical protein
MCRNIRAAGVVRYKSEAAVGIPQFQGSGSHPISPFQPDPDQRWILYCFVNPRSVLPV